MNDESEKLISKCGTMNEIRKIAMENPTLGEDFIDSLQSPICLVNDVFNRQSLKSEPFKTFTASSEIGMEKFWETIQLVDDSVTYCRTYKIKELYGKQTTEDHRPSLKNVKKTIEKMKTTKVKHTMPFYPSTVRAKIVGITVSCVECEKPRLLFSARKLSEEDNTSRILATLAVCHFVIRVNLA
ncbi:unnamed protein product [Rhizophagus irregularis]|nr:unnamed protein product [Rhizophagus irregularis]